MADGCVQCKTKRNEGYWNANPSNKHGFFKIMLGNFNNTLRIPRKFKEEFKGKLERKVTLRGPSGNRWATTLARRGKDLVLEEGWQDFVKDHRLNEGDFLVFHYFEDSFFDVEIFDATTCVREDSHFVEPEGSFCDEGCCSRHQCKKKMKGKELMQDEVVEVEEKNVKEESDEEEIEHDNPDSGNLNNNGKTERTYSMYYVSNRRAITEKDKKRAFQKASKFQTKKPSCTIRMKPSHVCRLFTLTIPRPFAVNWLPKSKDIKLKVGSKSWGVKLNWTKQCTLTRGWAQFVLDNNLETEDVCVMELMDTGTSQQQTLLNVHIFRAVEKTVPLTVVKPFQPQ